MEVYNKDNKNIWLIFSQYAELIAFYSCTITCDYAKLRNNLM